LAATDAGAGVDTGAGDGASSAPANATNGATKITQQNITIYFIDRFHIFYDYSLF
jgi:hypothetical protein